MLSDITYQDTRAKCVFPAGRTGLIPVPKELSIHDYLESRDHVYLYNPFAPTLTVEKVPMSSLSFRKLAKGYIVESPNIIQRNSRGSEEIARYQHLQKSAEAFWGVFVAVTRRLLLSPKREQDRKLDISPDMGLVIQKPKRKIEGPRLVHRPGPPKPGGR